MATALKFVFINKKYMTKDIAHILGIGCIVIGVVFMIIGGWFLYQMIKRRR